MVGRIKAGGKEEGRGNKNFKKGEQAESRGGCLKKGGRLEPPNELRGKLEQNAEFKCCTCSRQKTQQVSVTDIYLDGQSLEIKEKLCILVIQYGLRRGAIDSLITRI